MSRREIKDNAVLEQNGKINSPVERKKDKLRPNLKEKKVMPKCRMPNPHSSGKVYAGATLI